ncbi:MAG: hypothetical protein LBP26_03660 [Clostridiales bacterium]|jgi:hypothetical protein|nr:hypothetical protein [Clostridiales bacterium]
MMKSRKFIGAGLLALAAFLCAAAALFWPVLRSEQDGGFGVTAPLAAESGDAAGLQASYKVGTELTVPALNEEIDGATVAGSVFVRFPDGSLKSKTALTLSQTGKYGVEYRFFKDGALQKTVVKDFCVYDSLASVTGEGGAVYGKYDQAASESGLVVNLRPGAEFTLNKPIDLSGLTKTEPFIKLYIAPQKPDAIDFLNLTLKLTDVRDPNNVLTVNLRRNADGHQWAYVLAGGGEQLPSGLEPSKNIVHRNNSFGTPVALSFYGLKTPYESDWLGLALDAGTMEFAAVESDNRVVPVVDLDSLSYFNDSFGGLWRGFGGNPVRLTVTASEFTNDLSGSARFVIKELSGVDLSAELCADTEPPVITVDREGYDTLPSALAGHSYPVLKATAFDKQTGVVPVTARAFYNYYTPSLRVELDSLDGTFTPPFAGGYVLEYVSRDRYGNESVTVVPVTAVGSVPALNVSAVYNGRVTSGYAGARIPVSPMLFSGGAGGTAASIRVSGAGYSATVTSEGYFTAFKAGTYAVVYEAVDFIGQHAMYAYNVTLSYAAEPVFSDEPALPASYLGGFAYALPGLNAYRVTASGAEAVGAEPSVTQDGQPVAVTNGRVELSNPASGTGEAVITYTAGGASIVRTVPVISTANGSNLDLSKFFLTDAGVTASLESDAVRISSDEASAGFVYARNLVVQGLDFRFDLVADAKKYQALEFTLTDSLNPAQSVRVAYVTSSSQPVVQINGADAMLIPASSGSGSVALNYADGRIVYGGAWAKIRTYADGSAFAGFDSGLIKLAFRFAGVSGAAQIAVTNINNQVFNSRGRDTNVPVFALLSDSYGGTLPIGSDAPIPRAVVSDVLAPESAVTVSVQTPSGGAATAVDGTLLSGADPSKEYKINLSIYGSYIVVYEYTDLSNNRSEMYSFVIIVDKVEPPKITLAFEPRQTAAAGELVAVPSATATDLDGAAVTVYRYLFTVQGRIIELSDSNDSFKAEHAGVYTLRYMAIDALGNMTVSEYQITVTGGNS